MSEDKTTETFDAAAAWERAARAYAVERDEAERQRDEARAEVMRLRAKLASQAPLPEDPK